MSTDSLLSNRNPSLLHPLLRKALWVMQPILQAEGYPFGIFEGFRSPERQAKLYARGRTSPGRIITRAKAWESYHQYGLAADMVALPEGKWSWSVPQAWWDRLHALGREHGLEALSFEQPHLQLAKVHRPGRAARPVGSGACQADAPGPGGRHDGFRARGAL